MQKGDTLDKIARRNSAAGPAAIAPTISDRAKDPNVAGVAKAAPIVEPAAPAAGTDAGTVPDERAAYALASKPFAPVVATGDNASATAADERAAYAMASKPTAPVSKPALNTNSVPYAIDAKATTDRDRVGAAAKAAAALMKEELQDMLRLSGLQGK